MCLPSPVLLKSPLSLLAAPGSPSETARAGSATDAGCSQAAVSRLFWYQAQVAARLSSLCCHWFTWQALSFPEVLQDQSILAETKFHPQWFTRPTLMPKVLLQVPGCSVQFIKPSHGSVVHVKLLLATGCDRSAENQAWSMCS